MALSEENKFRVIFALCHTGKILDENSTHFNSIIDDRLKNLNAFVEAQVLSLLTKIEASKTAINTTGKDNVKRIGDIELDTKVSRSVKIKELNRLLSELSNLLDIPNRCKSGGGMKCLVL